MRVSSNPRASYTLRVEQPRDNKVSEVAHSRICGNPEQLIFKIKATEPPKSSTSIRTIFAKAFGWFFSSVSSLKKSFKEHYYGSPEKLELILKEIHSREQKFKPEEFKFFKEFLKDSLPPLGSYGASALYAMHREALLTVTNIRNSKDRGSMLMFLAKASRIVGLEAALDMAQNFSDDVIKKAARLDISHVTPEGVSKLSDYLAVKDKFNDKRDLFGFFVAVESLRTPKLKNEFLDKAISESALPSVFVGKNFYAIAPHLPENDAWQLLEKISAYSDLLSRYDIKKNAIEIAKKLSSLPEDLQIELLKHFTQSKKHLNAFKLDLALIQRVKTGERSKMGLATLNGYLLEYKKDPEAALKMLEGIKNA
jgi:hypothetical protein